MSFCHQTNIIIIEVDSVTKIVKKLGPQFL